jgi:formylglycine-generating enzyme required for sulfatase activity
MVALGTGDFLMGSNLGDESPVRKVTITRRFAVSKFEVTFAEWNACVADGSCVGPNDGGWGHGTRPVINVSWDDIAKGYLPWLGRKTGQRYRLLTEAEWEYAARAGSQTEFSWGGQIEVNKANCGNCGSRWDKKETAPVGSFAPNRFGLYDMQGNVAEWTEDCYDGGYPSYRRAPTDGSAQTTYGCIVRVFRGGSWASEPLDLRSAHRRAQVPSSRLPTIGFRVARTLE